ncbi:cobaltochelatase subunit CobN [Pseudoroseomonas cervicalis]|uniref:cobaltochelatase subunit CobN n=1 Tax=Teichococcus cervicalis TaxID=204525 RepID=UPI0022F1AFE3|nr:cobaltochelatase subunit CobN [Pseudoroseomonas cervicalis]WBV43432.1 cobaltochelatase subunit CobN [Pseudoroseomonas cervicalis]
MHLLVRETRSMDDAEQAEDLGHAPADLVLLSFSDADLGAAAMGWSLMPEPRPTLRLANLGRLRHPMSVDLYAEDTLARSRCVVIRLLGGLEYWGYGAEEVAALCRRQGIPLALLPGCGRDDARLAELSTVPPAMHARMDKLLAEGGPDNLAAALRLAAHWAGLGPDDGTPPLPLPLSGEHPLGAEEADPQAVIVFYRSHLLSGDIAPMLELATALRARGLRVRGLYVASLKEAGSAALVRSRLSAWRPAVVLNATAFAARQEGESPLDAAGAPVLQVMLSGAARQAWAASPRGLSQSDLAMQVALPELDGRLLTAAIGFKAPAEPLPGLEQSRTLLAPDASGIALAADRALGWARLAATPRAARRVAVLLSDYPAMGGQEGHAVGLDSFASLAALLGDLASAGYDIGGATVTADTLAQALTRGTPTPLLSLEDYRAAFATLPEALRQSITAAWGDPEDDPACRDGAFHARHLQLEKMLLAVQPDRGGALDRSAAYHDPDTPPRHGYIAFYLALRRGADALLHLGTHGTLEWLPGKAVALSEACAPRALLGGLPVAYPFIVNNPGEAAVAKRRLGAVTIGHLTPPLKSAGHHGAAAELEKLIDEYAAADGLDRRRTALLRRAILDRAGEAGLLEEGHIPRDIPEEEALSRLDAWLCDVKELQIRDGLHIFGRPPAPERRALLLENLARATPGFDPARLDACAAAERDALLAALDGRFVPPGPAGAPTRGRADVLPTGRNLYSIDPRGVPTRSALALAEKAAEDLLRRHRQEQGDWPRHLMLDLWGSATLRTGGEDLALALLLMGARPVWDAASARVTGVEIIPLALLDRPRVDVTLRISGLFRDAFPAQIALFDEAVRAIAARDEAPEWNALAASAQGLDGAALRHATARIFGAAPGSYGTGLEEVLAKGAWEQKEDLGRAWIAGSAAAYGQGLEGVAAPEALRDRLALAEAFLHSQDHDGTDLLDSPEVAAHAGGFAAAAALLGASPALYHADTSRPGDPRLRSVAEEVARVLRGRAANPAWIAGMMRHGRRGAAEITRAVEALHGFAATLPTRFDRQFDLLHAATLGDETVLSFLAEHNPEALAALRARFAEARERGLWHARRNDV